MFYSNKFNIMRGSIKIYKHIRRPTCVTAYFNQCALDIIGFKEIVVKEKGGELFISRPTMESKKTWNLMKQKTISFAVKDADALIGEYYIEQDDNADEFLLNLE